jgi:hypothetical protein
MNQAIKTAGNHLEIETSVSPVEDIFFDYTLFGDTG